MGIFDWLFGKGTNKEIERKERMKKTFGKYREEINQKKKKEDEEKAKKEDTKESRYFYSFKNILKYI